MTYGCRMKIINKGKEPVVLENREAYVSKTTIAPGATISFKCTITKDSHPTETDIINLVSSGDASYITIYDLAYLAI